MNAGRNTRWVFAFLPILMMIGCSRATAPSSPTRILRIAAASDLRFAMEELETSFQERRGQVEFRVSFGSSGNLFTQLSQDAPFDLFLSADIALPQELTAMGKADASDLFPFCQGHLVVWIRNDSPLPIESKQHEILTDERVRRISVANPRHAPYGRAAMSAIEHLGWADQLRDRWVIADNVAQAAQFVESGSADVGIIARSLASAPAMQAKGRFVPLPTDASPPLVQGGLIMKQCVDRPTAEAFRDFLLSADARAILTRYGFDAPAEE